MADTLLIEQLDISEFIAAAREMDIFITNDTGPMHLAALAGAPILLVMDSRAPLTYLPLADKLSVLNNAYIEEISVDNAYSEARTLLK